MERFSGGPGSGSRHEIPETLGGLLNVLVANGRLAEFADRAKEIDSTIEDQTEKAEALAELVEELTKE